MVALPWWNCRGTKGAFQILYQHPASDPAGKVSCLPPVYLVRVGRGLAALTRGDIHQACCSRPVRALANDHPGGRRRSAFYRECRNAR